MIRLILYSLTVLFLISCSDNKTEHKKSISNINKSIINTQYLKDSNNNQNIVLIDVRKPKEYIKGHLPKAQNIWRPDIRNNDTIVGGLLASKQKIKDLLSKLGATNKSLIIVYDAKGNPDAARLWWILKYYGHNNVALLNGGITAFDSTKLTTEIFTPTPTLFKFQNEINTSYFADKNDVLAAIDDTNSIILDNRSKEEFNGLEKKGNAGKAGRIPNSIFIDYSDNIDYKNKQKFKSIKDLELVYKNIPKDKKIITYCQSGVRSALTLFVLTELLDYKNVTNYDGSWLEWSNDSTLPFTQDSIL